MTKKLRKLQNYSINILFKIHIINFNINNQECEGKEIINIHNVKDLMTPNYSDRQLVTNVVGLEASNLKFAIIE